ncbi:MAG: hypothetical protein K1X83_00470 [Oligoflexia bacterium]|nr:hypothetical protein [Oligoflexia bacterium]
MQLRAAIEALAVRLAKIRRLNLLALVVSALSYGALAAYLGALYSRSLALLILIVMFGLIVLLLRRATRAESVDRFEAAQLIDRQYKTADRTLALVDLAGAESTGPVGTFFKRVSKEIDLQALKGQPSVQSEFADPRAQLIAAQLEPLLDGMNINELSPLRLRTGVRKLFLPVPIVWLAFAILFGTRYFSPPVLENPLAQAIANLIEQQKLPEQLKDRMSELAQLLDSADADELEIEEALHAAEEELKLAVENEKLTAKEKIVEKQELKQDSEKIAPTPTPKAEPTPAPKQAEQDKKKQDQDQNQKQDQKSAEKQDQTGEGSNQGEQGQKEQQQKGDSAKEDQGQDSGGEKGQGQKGQGGEGQSEGEKQAGDQGKGGEGSEAGESGKGQNGEPQQGDSKGDGSKDGQSKEGKGENAQGGSGGSEGQALNQAQQVLDQVKQEVEKKAAGEKSGQQQNKSGAAKPGEGENQPGGEQGAAKQAQSKQPGQAKSKSNQPNSESKAAKDQKEDQSGNGASGAQKAQDTEQRSNAGDSDAEKSSLPTQAEAGQHAGELGPETGLGENKGFKDTEVKPGDEKYDASKAQGSGELSRNPNEARTKTDLADVKLAKPEAAKGKEEQQIPLEYRDLMESSGRSQ